MSNCTTPSQASRDALYVSQAIAYRRFPSRALPPDAHLLAHEGAGTIGRATLTPGRDGNPLVLIYFAAQDGSLCRRGRAFTPPVAAALKVALWFGMRLGASAGSLCTDPHTAWFLTEGKAGPLAREQAMAAALSMHAQHHAGSGLSKMSHAAYRTLLVSAFDLAELTWRDAEGRGPHASEAA